MICHPSLRSLSCNKLQSIRSAQSRVDSGSETKSWFRGRLVKQTRTGSLFLAFKTLELVVPAVPFSADWENRTPLLATTPTGCPHRRPKPVTSVVPYRALNSSRRLPSRMRASAARTSHGCRGSAGTTPAAAARAPHARPIRRLSIARCLQQTHPGPIWLCHFRMRQCRRARKAR
jgi:hypothetical protein